MMNASVKPSATKTNKSGKAPSPRPGSSKFKNGKKPIRPKKPANAKPAQSRLARLRAYGVPRLSSTGLNLVLIFGAVAIVINLAMLAFGEMAWVQTWGRTLILGGGAVVFGMLGLSLVELARLCYWSPFLPSLSIERHLNANLPVHTPSFVTLHLSAGTPAPSWLWCALIDNAPANAIMSNLPVEFAGELLHRTDDEWQDELFDNASIKTRADGVEIGYTLIPTVRGEATFDGLSLIFGGWLGLWDWHYHYPKVAGVNRVRVFANFKAVMTGNLLAMAQKSAVDGVLKRRIKGQGQDFHQIRAYSEGDSIRHVDWRATARLRRLMSKEFQDEQEQEILFLLDTSQNMRHQRLVALDGGHEMMVGHLDTVLNAMLLLANTAHQQGDATGFISFSGNHDKVAPPKKGVGVVNYLLNQSFDLQASLKMPDYISSARMALSLLKKRSLVVLLTSTRSENFDELLMAVKLLSGKHLLVVANLYEQDLATLNKQIPHDENDAQLYHSVSEHLTVQRSLQGLLSAKPHVYPIHCTPDELPRRLVQTYLQLKQQQRL